MQRELRTYLLSTLSSYVCAQQHRRKSDKPGYIFREIPDELKETPKLTKFIVIDVAIRTLKEIEEREEEFIFIDKSRVSDEISSRIFVLSMNSILYWKVYYNA